MQPRLSLNLQSSYISLLRAGMTGMCYHTQLLIIFQNDLHPSVHVSMDISLVPTFR
jgi:hypothetical protein